VNELRLNGELQEDPNGRILLRREGSTLHAWYINSAGEHSHFNPFTFGLAFHFRELATKDFGALDSFLAKGARKRDSYEIPFPRSSQIEIMEFFLKEEYNAKLSFAQRDSLCELFEQLFPVYWRYAITSHTCILYDGFYGRGPSEAYLPYQSSLTYEELIENVFGVARKDTLREGRKIDAMGLNLAYVFRDILPTEVILQELSTHEGHFAEFPIDQESYSSLARLSAPIRRRLFADLIMDFKLDAQVVSDALDLLNVIPEDRLKRLKGTNNWNQLHRRLMIHCDAVDGDQIIKPPTILERLEEPCHGIVFKPLRNAKDFVTLGDWLDICIGKAGYFMRAVRGESYCLVGLIDEIPYAALELKVSEGVWKVNQLRRENNEWLDNQKLMIGLIEERLNHESQ
jgi:hypothetical protein